MGHKKLIRFRAVDTYKNVLQYPENMKGNWKDFFTNSNPITLELACGKGEYSVNLGRQNKDKNYIGVDIKGNRIYTGAKAALEEKLTNVGFLRIQIGQITDYFAAGEVEAIWIVFADPFLKKAKKQAYAPQVSAPVPAIARQPGGIINLKTDSKELYDFTVETIAEQGCMVHENIADIYGRGLATGALAIQTFYEKMHLAGGRTIYYISFSLPQQDIVIPERFRKEDDAEDQVEEQTI